MCLITTQKKAVITTRKMTVYKFMEVRNGIVYSLHYSAHQWELGKLYKTVIKDDVDWCAADGIDMSWLDENHYGWRCNKAIQKKLKCIGAGFHAIATKKRLLESMHDGGCYEEASIYKCTIPAGSEIYKDATGLIVSNQIIVESKYEVE